MVDPEQFAVHSERLRRIEDGIEKINGKIDTFAISVGIVSERLARVETRDELSENRIVKIEGSLDDRRKEINALIVKVAVIAATLSGGASAWIGHWFP